MAHRPNYQVPSALDESGLEVIRKDWRSAAQRALQAGFEIVEVHAAHGFLLNSFLSPPANLREDRYGGDFEGRIRFPLEVIAIVREVWPQDKPVFVRVSATYWAEGGWTGDDTVEFAKRLRELGVDVVDCSSGGIGYPTPPLALDYQTRYAARVHRSSFIANPASSPWRSA